MKNNKEEKKGLSEQAENALEVFCKKFTPAKEELDATHFYTTEEIQEALKKLTPEAIVSPAEVYGYLYPLGYRPTIDTSHTMLVYKWMLKVSVVHEKFSNLEEK